VATSLTIHKFGILFFGNIGRDIIKDEVDTVFFTGIHDAMGFLIVNLINIPNLEAIGAPINHEPYKLIGGNGDVNAVAKGKRW
jgi:hypothetical protein